MPANRVGRSTDTRGRFTAEYLTRYALARKCAMRALAAGMDADDADAWRSLCERMTDLFRDGTSLPHGNLAEMRDLADAMRAELAKLGLARVHGLIPASLIGLRAMQVEAGDRG